MEEASDLLPPDALDWLLQTLLQFRRSGGHGDIRFIMEHGRIGKVGHSITDKYPFKKDKLSLDSVTRRASH